MPIDKQKLLSDMNRKLTDRLSYFKEKEQQIELFMKEGRITSQDYKQGRMDLKHFQEDIEKLKKEIEVLNADISL